MKNFRDLDRFLTVFTTLLGSLKIWWSVQKGAKYHNNKVTQWSLSLYKKRDGKGSMAEQIPAYWEGLETRAIEFSFE